MSDTAKSCSGSEITGPVPVPAVYRRRIAASVAGRRYAVGAVALIAVAAWFASQDPERNGLAAAALAAALVLDGLARLMAGAVSRRLDLDLTMRRQPSLVLALAGRPLLPAACLAASPLLAPDAFPVAASLMAGLLAMSALARLTLTRAGLRARRRPSQERAESGPRQRSVARTPRVTRA